MSVDVTRYKDPPASLFALLRRHVPHSLPLLRRLQFTRFPGGITEHARILWASDVEPADDLPDSAHFTAGYLDFSRGPETELWLYSSLERDQSPAAEDDPTTAHADHPAASQAEAALREVKRLRDEYYRCGGGGGEERENGGGRPQPTVLIGTLNERLRRALAGRGAAFPYVGAYDKWLFRAGALPEDVRALPEGMRWDTVCRRDIPLVLSRSPITRRERTVVLLRSRAIKLEDGTPVAWALLGPDSSLSSLHCEPEYRGRGLAKAVAVKLMRDHLKDYGDEGYGWADVAPDNPSSQGVCKSLGGQIAWTVSWADLDRSFPDI
ncbi:hypothetical protein DL768_010203 [Monosporascus sp. mg162]|nr:hypothetical protein DL768_010203 [Monosporascus sp. mg162]